MKQFADGIIKVGKHRQNMSKQTWTYTRFAKAMNSQMVSPGTYSECEAAFNSTLSECRGNLPQLRAALFNAFYPLLARTCVNAAVDEPEKALTCLHLIWRSKAISLAAYLEHMHRLFQKKANPRIRPLGVFDLNDILTLAISASILGTEDAATYFFNQALALTDSSSARIEPKAFRAGPVEPFLFNLLSRYYDERKRLDIPETSQSRVFRDVEQGLGTESFIPAIERLAELKEMKLMSKDLDNDLIFGLNTGVNFFVPFEVFFATKVHSNLSATIMSSSHELLNLPICREIQRFTESGANYHVEKLLLICGEELPGFSVPWEDRLKDLPASEFRDLLVNN